MAALQLPTRIEPLEDFICSGIVLTFLGFDTNANFDLRLHACKRRYYVGDCFAKALNFSDAECYRVGKFATRRDWRGFDIHRLPLPDY